MEITTSNKKQKCNGYYFICKEKGIPIIDLSFGGEGIKPSIGHFCIDCCKNYLKQHPELPKETKAGIIMAIKIHKKVKKEIEKAIKSKN